MTQGILDSREAASMVPPNLMTHRALDFREAASMILRRIGILSLGKFFCFLYGLMGLLSWRLGIARLVARGSLERPGPVVAKLGIGVGAIIVFVTVQSPHGTEFAVRHVE
jgi:hypothetical protein